MRARDITRAAVVCAALVLGCGGGAAHRVTLVPPAKTSAPIAALIGHEKDAGIAVFYRFVDRGGAPVDLDSVATGMYSVEVKPPCARSTERTVEITGSREVRFEIPKVEGKKMVVQSTITVPEMRYAGTKKTLDIEAGSEVTMVRPWPLKGADDGFSAAKDCIGALVRVVDPPSPAGELYVVPRSALRSE